MCIVPIEAGLSIAPAQLILLHAPTFSLRLGRGSAAPRPRAAKLGIPCRFQRAGPSRDIHFDPKDTEAVYNQPGVVIRVGKSFFDSDGGRHCHLWWLVPLPQLGPSFCRLLL